MTRIADLSIQGQEMYVTFWYSNQGRKYITLHLAVGQLAGSLAVEIFMPALLIPQFYFAQ